MVKTKEVRQEKTEIVHIEWTMSFRFIESRLGIGENNLIRIRWTSSVKFRHIALQIPQCFE